MPYIERNIDYLRATGRDWMAYNMAMDRVTDCDKVRLFFSNLWQVNRVKLPAGIVAMVVGSVGIHNVDPTSTSFAFAIGLSVMLLIISYSCTSKQTAEQLLPEARSPILDTPVRLVHLEE